MMLPITTMEQEIQWILIFLPINVYIYTLINLLQKFRF